MLIANECKGKSSVWDLYRMIHSAHVSVHSHRACILHRLALILEPVTCQEVSTCRVLTVSLAESNPASGCQGLHSRVGAMWWKSACGNFPPSPPQTWSQWVARCHHSAVTSTARTTRWVARTAAPSSAPLLSPGASQAVGLLVALCTCFVTWQSESVALAMLVLFVFVAARWYCWVACSATCELHTGLLWWEHWLNTLTEAYEWEITV